MITYWQFWLAVGVQTFVAAVASIKYILRIERRLMRIESKLGIEYNG